MTARKTNLRRHIEGLDIRNYDQQACDIYFGKLEKQEKRIRQEEALLRALEYEPNQIKAGKADKIFAKINKKI